MTGRTSPLTQAGRQEGPRPYPAPHLSPSAPTILIVSANREFASSWSAILANHGFAPRLVSTVHDALDLLTIDAVDVVLGDAELAQDGALELARSFYGRRCPSLLILGRDDLIDRVMAVEMGADDHLPREIDGRELVARVRILARSRAASVSRRGPASWRLKPEVRMLEAPNGRSVVLSALHWTLLILMAASNGRPLDAQSAAAAIPSFRNNPDGALRTAMSRLKRRLANGIGAAPISCSHGSGYILDVPLTLTANDG